MPKEVNKNKFKELVDETLEAQMDALRDDEGFVQSLPDAIVSILK